MADGYRDDPTILPGHQVWRRIPPWHLVPDENQGGVRISTAAFEDDRDGHPMSVILGDAVRGAGRVPASVIAPDLKGYGVAAVTAELARSKSQIIVKDPLPEEPAHGLVVGNKSNSVRKAFAREACWIVSPPSAVVLHRSSPALKSGKNEQNAHTLLLNPVCPP